MIICLEWSEAIGAVYPNTEHQLCIVHQIRNSLQYVSYKNRKELAADLKLIYQAVNEDEALAALADFDQKWGKQYPHIARSWQNNWHNLLVFLQYPAVIRRIIYTTNSIEGVNSQLRKVTNNKRVFPNDDAVVKIFYLTINLLLENGLCLFLIGVKLWLIFGLNLMIGFNSTYKFTQSIGQSLKTTLRLTYW